LLNTKEDEEKGVSVVEKVSECQITKMVSIWKSNSARVALRSITRSLAAGESATAANHHTSSVPSRLSSVRHLRSCQDLISRL